MTTSGTRDRGAGGAGLGDDGGGTGLILAAGYGRRLLPLTARIPKPLLPVLNRPLLGRAADRLHAAGVDRLIANTHHLAEAVAEYARRDRPDLRLALSHEPELLGTGGALHGARDFLAAADWFVLWNGDVLCDCDLAALIAAHLHHGPEATLLLVDWPAVNSVRLDDVGRVVDIGGRLGAAAAGRDLTYSGIAVISRPFLDRIPAGFSALADALLAAVGEGSGAVRGAAPTAVLWHDLGTVTRYLDTHARLLADRGGRRLHRGDAVEVAPGARLEGWNCIGAGARIPAAARLRECVVLAGTRVADGVVLERAVVGPGWVVTEDQNRLLGLKSLQDVGFGADTEATEIAGHGSDRRFWRLAAGGREAVVMRVPPEDEEFERYVAVARFLDAAGLGGPRLLAVDTAARTVVMESLGRDALDKLAHARPQHRAEMYRRVLDLLVALQVGGTAAAAACPAATDRSLDDATLRWETDYFRRRFLAGYAGLPEDELAHLDDDFAALASSVAAQPYVLMHRDFQSRNILIQDGRVRLVDFQGMRLGPVGYDPMSLLRDAYVDLGDPLREELIAYYGDGLAAARGADPGPIRLRAWCTAAGLQRTMQALGAFGYLGLVKRKRQFLAHIPLAWRYLRDGLRELHGFDLPPEDCPRPLTALERVVAEVGPRA